jgi:GDP-L-fucose synthase
LYVDDAAEAIVLAAEKFDSPEPVNIGSGHEISIRDLAILIGEMTQFKGRIVWDSNYPDGQPRRALDTSRAERYFGFRASTSLQTGIQNTIDWYKSSL